MRIGKSRVKEVKAFFESGNYLHVITVQLWAQIVTTECYFKIFVLKYNLST